MKKRKFITKEEALAEDRIPASQGAVGQAKVNREQVEIYWDGFHYQVSPDVCLYHGIPQEGHSYLIWIPRKYAIKIQ